MRRKYGNKKTEVDGIVFDSKVEAARWSELLLLQKAGVICDLERQVRYELAPSVRFTGEKRVKPALTYTVDFLYRVTGGGVVAEDTKGVSTPVYRVKKHLMMSVHGIEVIDRIKAR